MTQSPGESAARREEVQRYARAATEAAAGARNADLLKDDVFRGASCCADAADKPAVLAEAFRALAPGGRIGISDVVAEDRLTPAGAGRRRIVATGAAEATGTALLAAAIVGSGIAAERAFPDSPGTALLVNAFATGAALTALIAALGGVSAAFNPLVTLLDLLARRIASRRALVAVGAQLAGAATGVVAANVMFAHPPLALAGTERVTGATLLSEIVATAGLLLVVSVTSRAGDPLRLGVAVGGYVAAAMWFTGSTAFANPVLTLARVGTDTFAGIAPASAAGFVAAQALALPVAVLLIRLITGRTR